MSTLAPLAPQLLIHFMSFPTLGIFWACQQTQLNYFARTDHRLTWIHLAFLLVVVDQGQQQVLPPSPVRNDFTKPSQ